MSTESWSPATELSSFMLETQTNGNKLAAYIAMSRKFFGQAWALEQLARLHQDAESNAEALSRANQSLASQGALPSVLHDGQLGKWLGVSTAPDNCYSLVVQSGSIERRLSIENIILVDAETVMGAGMLVTKPCRRVVMTLGSTVLAPQAPLHNSLPF